MHPIRAALNGLVDYAGLFPPAALDLPQVVANVLAYLRSPERWLLGRLIVPRGRLDDLAGLFERADAGGPTPCTVSVLAPPDAPLDGIADDIVRFNDRLASRRIAVVAVETAVRSASDVVGAARAIPERYERYVEAPLDGSLPEVLRAAADAGLYGKVRTGGVTAGAFPAPAALARFMAACAALEVPFKATAGLHHPFRGSYPLTYEPQSPCATMHGFMNLVMAGALLYTGRIDEAGAADVLGTEEPFEVEPGGLRWRSRLVTGEELSFSRAHLFRSVGSCSFEDALTDLRRAGWEPAPVPG